MPSDRSRYGNGPERQHPLLCYPLPSPLGAHLGPSLGFPLRVTQAPISLGGYATNPSEAGGAGETRPTLALSGVEPVRTPADALGKRSGGPQGHRLKSRWADALRWAGIPASFHGGCSFSFLLFF